MAGTVDLTLTAKFSSPWKNEAAEVDAMIKGTWEPSGQDFGEVADADQVANGDIFEVSDLRTFFGPILQQKPKTVDRVNVITHANPDFIALSGEVKASGAVMLKLSGGVAKPLDGGIDFDALSGLRAKTADLKKIQDSFAPGAVIIFYACHTGKGPVGDMLLHEIAKTLKVTVKGFTDQIYYCPTYRTKPQKEVLDRRLTERGSCSSAAKSGFRHLAPQVVKKP